MTLHATSCLISLQCILTLLYVHPASPITLRYVLKKGDAWAWRFTWAGKETTEEAFTPKAVESTIAGTIIQRVESINRDGTYLVSVDVRVESVRLISDGRTIPPASGKFSERSMIRITPFGRILDVNPPQSFLPAGLQALRQIAIIQFPESPIKVGETWEVQTSPGMTTMTATLADIEVIGGKPLARIALQSEIPFQGSRNLNVQDEPAQPVEMNGHIALRGTQQIRMTNGITTNAHADITIDLEARRGSVLTKQHSVIVLDAKPAAVPALTVIAPKTQPQSKKKTAAKSTPIMPPERPRTGEIRIDGRIVSVAEDGTITVAVQSFMNDQGRSTQLSTSKPKTIQLSPSTEIGQRNVRGAISQEALTPGQQVSVIGEDLGSGKPLPARKVTIESAPSGPPPARRQDKRGGGAGKGKSKG